MVAGYSNLWLPLPFRVLKEKELKQFGEYRTRRLVLGAWDKLKLPIHELAIGGK